jgi:NhaP-type Na+/H+ or K+/H+ antiporter
VSGSGLVAIALLVLAYAAFSRRLSGTVITAAMVFVAGGILASDEVLGWLDPAIESQTVRWIAEATLAVVLFSDASRIDLAALRREYVVPLRLLAIGLPLTIVAGTLAGVALLGEPVFIEAVLLAICLLRRTLPCGRRSSPIPAFLHAFVRGSTSRAGSTTASASRCF